ncbi:MAG: histidine phosphatase family protein [Micrococcales bacterium]|nr:histidine phosphatase family protein [Micrococcales bacterium]
MAVSQLELRSLVLLRHAKAERGDWGLDRDRGLAPRGRAQSAAVGRDLADQGFMPDVALVSSAKRTVQTYDLVAVNANWHLVADILDDLYRAWTDDLIDLLCRVSPTARSVLVVGHEPTISAAAGALAGIESSPDALSRLHGGLPTAGRAELRFAGDWIDLGPAGATLTEVITPLA